MAILSLGYRSRESCLGVARPLGCTRDRRPGGYLIIDELVVRVAQQDQVLVPVSIGWGHERIASRAGWTRGDDVGNIAKNDGLFPRWTFDDEYPPAVAERTPVA